MTNEDSHWLNEFQDILRLLKEEDGELESITQVAEETGLSTGNASQRIERLADAGLIEKEQDGIYKKVVLKRDGSISDEEEPHWLNKYQDVLRGLRNAGGEVEKVGDLAEELTGSSVYRRIDELDEEGIVEKSLHPQDGRKTKIVMKGYEESGNAVGDLESGKETAGEDPDAPERFREDTEDSWYRQLGSHGQQDLQLLKYEKKSFGGYGEVLWLIDGDRTYVTNLDKDMENDEGFAYAAPGGDSPIPGMKGAEVYAVASSEEALERETQL